MFKLKYLLMLPTLFVLCTLAKKKVFSKRCKNFHHKWCYYDKIENLKLLNEKA